MFDDPLPHIAGPVSKCDIFRDGGGNSRVRLFSMTAVHLALFICFAGNGVSLGVPI